jgi:hypothetical protein
MKVTVETKCDDEAISVGSSDMPGGETVQDAIECFKRALFAAGFADYEIGIVEEDGDVKCFNEVDDDA